MSRNWPGGILALMLATSVREGNVMPWEDPMEKKYGAHELPPNDGTYTVDCIHGCGFSIGPSRSGGAVPCDNLMSTPCPNNPENGVRLGGDKDKIAILSQIALGESNRAGQMERLATEANARLGEGAIAIAVHRDKLLKEGRQVNRALDSLRDSVPRGIDLRPPPPPEDD